MPGSDLLKETLNMYSELSLIYVVNACRHIVKQGVPDTLEEIMDRVEKLRSLGDLMSRALEAMYTAEEMDMRDYGGLDEDL